MTPQELIERVAGAMADLPELKALFVGGSYGNGTADAHSDVDLIALAEPTDIATLAAGWRRVLEDIDRIVYWNELGSGPIVLNAVTADWLRYDMLIMAPAAFTGRARTAVRPLIDRIGCFEALSPTLPPRTPDPRRVLQMVNEFIRVIGLLPVVVGAASFSWPRRWSICAARSDRRPTSPSRIQAGCAAERCGAGADGKASAMPAAASPMASEPR